MFVLALPHDSSGYHFLFCRTRKQKVLHSDGLVRGRQTYAFPGSHRLFPGQTLQVAVAPKCFFFCFMQIFHSETQILFGSHMELCTLYPALGNTRWRARGCFPSVPALSSFAMCRPVPVHRHNPPVLYMPCPVGLTMVAQLQVIMK